MKTRVFFGILNEDLYSFPVIRSPYGVMCEWSFKEVHEQHQSHKSS